MSIGLIGATCDPNNQPPNAPKARVAEYDATSITIVFGNNCIDPDNTGWCHQRVIVTGGGQNAFTVKAVGGVAVIPNRLPGKEYDIFPYHVDEGGARTNGETIYGFKTAGVTGPKVVGIAPTEMVAPATQVVLHGLGFDSSVTVRLIDPKNGTSYAAPIQSISPNRLTVSVPTPVGLIGRKPYFLVTNTNHKMATRADVIYLSASATDKPPVGQKLDLRVVRFQPSSVCTSGLLCDGCKTIDGWAPPVRDALAGGAGAPSGTDDWWADTWTDPFWTLVKVLVADTSREWSAICSEAWGAHPPFGGTVTPAPPVTLPSGTLYWFNIAFLDDDMYRLADRLRRTPSGSYVEFCSETSGDNARTMPGDCLRWAKNSPDYINVFFVGEFNENGIPIPAPALRGITNLPNANSQNTNNVIILTDNPATESRLQGKPITVNGQPTDYECISHYYKASDPTGQSGWFDWPNYTTSHTPNIMSHEISHLWSYVHDPDDPDPCWSPMVGPPTGTCGRGFNANLGGSLTASYWCNEAANDPATN